MLKEKVAYVKVPRDLRFISVLLKLGSHKLKYYLLYLIYAEWSLYSEAIGHIGTDQRVCQHLQGRQHGTLHICSA